MLQSTPKLYEPFYSIVWEDVIPFKFKTNGGYTHESCSTYSTYVDDCSSSMTR